MMRVVIIGFTLLLTLLSFKEDPTITYISQFKQIAVAEMHRTGIPASIKMAQALLESGAGRSSLANEANNHFGIKCGGRWSGDTYYLHDDDYNSNGKLIKSCFRHFESAEESFVAHSEFLARQNRYSFLFDFDPRDYRSWAKGLKKAGYATDKAYPQKLINIVEKYQLYLLDDLMLGENLDDLAYQESVESVRQTNRSRIKEKGFFIYPGSDPSQDIASLNDGSSKSSPRNRIKNSESIYHIVGFEESLSDIAQYYDLDETSLRLRNRIPKDGEPLPGEKIYLRKKIHLNKRPDYERENQDNSLASTDEFIF